MSRGAAAAARDLSAGLDVVNGHFDVEGLPKDWTHRPPVALFSRGKVGSEPREPVVDADTLGTRRGCDPALPIQDTDPSTKKPGLRVEIRASPIRDPDRPV